MSNFPTFRELYEAIINDCYTFLEQNSGQITKDSMQELLNLCQGQPEINGKSYVLYCLIYPMKKPSKYQIPGLFNFTKRYICNTYNYLVFNDKILKKTASIVDCSKSYIALIGYKYIFISNYSYYLLEFSLQTNENLAKVLNKYEISEKVKRNYEDKIHLLNKLISDWLDNNFSIDNLFGFKFINFGQKDEIKKNLYRTLDKPKTRFNENNITPRKTAKSISPYFQKEDDKINKKKQVQNTLKSVKDENSETLKKFQQTQKVKNNNKNAKTIKNIQQKRENNNKLIIILNQLNQQ